jgi:hypothetical protein
MQSPKADAVDEIIRLFCPCADTEPGSHDNQKKAADRVRRINLPSFQRRNSRHVF